jgi:choline dehydrogenase
VYPAYKKSCNFTRPNYDKIDPSFNISYDSSAFESGGGPLQVSYGNYLGPYGPYLEESLDKLGFERIPGLNSGRLIGYATITAAIDPKEATRSSSETSFLQLAAQNSNIKLYPQTMGSRILFDGNKRATGVEVQTNSLVANFKYHLNANKEVIISAGTVSHLFGNIVLFLLVLICL